jgi:hypothetical protein
MPTVGIGLFGPALTRPKSGQGSLGAMAPHFFNVFLLFDLPEVRLGTGVACRV